MRNSKRVPLFLLVLLACACFTTPALAESWSYFANNDDDDRIFLDEDSVQRKGNNIFELKLFQVPVKIEEDVVGTIGTYEISCSEKKFRVAQVTELFSNQAVRTTKTPVEWEAIPANSVADLMAKKACPSR